MGTRSRDSLFITSQLQSEWQRAGINFRVMLVGESGLGKTTFTRALLRPYVPEHILDEPADAACDGPIRARTTEITETTHKVENDGFPVEFTVIDVPGYGDAMDTTPWIDKIVSYVTGRQAEHYDNLGYPPRQVDATGRDGLVHVCLYFIAAHRLKGVDLEFLKRLQPFVNVVPVIAKADTMTLAERDAFRRLVLHELKATGVKIFQFSDAAAPVAAPKPAGAKASLEERLEPVPAEAPLPVTPQKSSAATRPVSTTQPPPFAVCASEDGTRVYPWGTLYVEDPAHSDLSLLRSMLFASSMLTAKRKTLELFESSYASPRRAAEAAEHARQRRAFQRERNLGRAVIAVGFLGGLGGLASILRPEWPAAAAAALDRALARLCPTRESMRRVLGDGLTSAWSGLGRLTSAAVALK